jgi:uncharacterized membrane protein required for colicin V production
VGLGYYSGLIRRVIGLVTIYFAFLCATNLNTGIAQAVLNFSPLTPAPDSRLYAYLLVMVVVLLAVEGLAAGYHEKLQFAVVPFNRLTGAIVAFVAGAILVGFLMGVLNGYAFPLGGSPTDNQVKLRTASASSVLVPVFVNSVKPLKQLFYLALPADPQTFFTTAHG